MTDADLLRQFREENSPLAFSELVARHMPWIYGVATRRTGDEHIAHDVSQAVFLLLTERANQIKDPTRLCAWLLQATVFASNHAIREEKRRRRRENIVAITRSEARIPDDAAAAMNAQIAEIESELTKLNAEDRTLIAVRFYMGRSFAELGEELGISSDAARKRVDRALMRLRHRLQSSEKTVLSLGPVLAGLAWVNKQIAPPPANTANAFQSNPTAVSISKGVSQMLIQSKLKMAAGIALVALALTGGILLACTGSEKQRQSATVPSHAASTPDRTCETLELAIIVSADGTTLTGYVKKTGKWAQVTGEHFSIENAIVAPDVATYRSRTAIYGFTER